MSICDGPSPTVQERFTAHAEARDYEMQGQIQRGLRANPVTHAQRLHAQQLLDRDLFPYQQQEVARLGFPQGLTAQQMQARQEHMERLGQFGVPWNVQKPPRPPVDMMGFRQRLQRMGDLHPVAKRHRRAAFTPSAKWLLAYLALAGVLLAVGRLF